MSVADLRHSLDVMCGLMKKDVLHSGLIVKGVRVNSEEAQKGMKCPEFRLVCVPMDYKGMKEAIPLRQSVTDELQIPFLIVVDSTSKLRQNRQSSDSKTVSNNNFLRLLHFNTKSFGEHFGQLPPSIGLHQSALIIRRDLQDLEANHLVALSEYKTHVFEPLITSIKSGALLDRAKYLQSELNKSMFSEYFEEMQRSKAGAGDASWRGSSNPYSPNDRLRGNISAFEISRLLLDPNAGATPL